MIDPDTIYMPKTIDDLLQDVKEDKVDNLSTTSFAFKRDVWEFFHGDDKESPFRKMRCVEFGTHKGQTTRILAHLFKHVYTINLPKHFDQAKALNKDLDNISYIEMDLYRQDVDVNFKHDPISVFFIDAVHSFDAVMYDVTRALNLQLADDDVYFIFDDFGSYKEVFTAVSQLMRIGQLERVQYLGHKAGFNFGGSPERRLFDHEGIICKLKR